jgi:uncharacterized protein
VDKFADLSGRFASDSGSKVGSIRRANQGVFAISAADEGSVVGQGGDFGGNFGADFGVMKVVRIVTTVEYYLEK